MSLQPPDGAGKHTCIRAQRRQSQKNTFLQSRRCALGRELSRGASLAASLCDARCVSNERTCVCFEVSGKEGNSGKHASNYGVPHFRKKKKKRNSKRERLQDDIIGKGHRVSNRWFLMHFYIAYVVCFFYVSSVAMTPGKKRHLWNNEQSTPPEFPVGRVCWSGASLSKWSGGRGWGWGVSLVIHASFSSSDRWEKAPERDGRYVSQTRRRPPASPRTLFAVKTRKKKKRSKQETDEAERNMRSRNVEKYDT